MSFRQKFAETWLDGLTTPEIDTLAWHEIGDIARFIARARVVVFPLVCLFAFGFVLLQPDPWRVWRKRRGWCGVGPAVDDFPRPDQTGHGS